MTSDTPDTSHPTGSRSTSNSPGAESQSDAGRAGSRPVLTVVSGQPTPEETAAVVVVLSALASQDATPPARPAPSQWSARSRFMQAPVHPGPDAWRATALPR